MKAQHYDTAMGVVWLVLDPLLLAGTFYLIRSVMGAGSSAGFSYWIAHLIMAVSFFYYVRDIVQGCAQAIVKNKSMVLNTAAPHGVFPAVALVRAAFDLVPTLIVYLGVHIATGRPFGISLLYLPLVVLLLTIFALGVGLFWAPLVVFFRDAGSLLPYIVRIWMYITPVMFILAEIPAGFRSLMVLNPLYPYFAMLEQVFAGHSPEFSYLVWAAAWSAFAIVVGGVAFLLRERDYAVRL
jgi:teichoic acid transport system permease protein